MHLEYKGSTELKDIADRSHHIKFWEYLKVKKW